MIGAAHPKTSGVRARALVVCASIGIALIGAEAVVRIVQPIGSERKPVYDADRDLGWSLAPYQNGSGLYQRNYAAPFLFDNPFRTNSLGMRDREHGEPLSGIARIAVVGDSFTEGWGVNEDEAYPKVLERSLPDVEVWNLGVVGYSTDQEYLQLKRLITTIRPKIVILGFYENDIADNTRRGTPWFPHMAKPRFTIEGTRLQLDRRTVDAQWSRETSTSRSVVARAKAVLSHLAIVRFADFTLKKFRYTRATVDPHAPNDYVDTWTNLNSYRIRQTPRMRDAWRVTERLLVEMNDLARANGATFAIVYIPRLMEVIPGELAREERRVGAPEPEGTFDLALPETTLAAVAGRHSIPLLRLRDTVAGHEPDQLYLAAVDGHLNARGQALVGGALATFIRNNHLLDAGAAVASTGVTAPSAPSSR